MFLFSSSISDASTLNVKLWALWVCARLNVMRDGQNMWNGLGNSMQVDRGRMKRARVGQFQVGNLSQWRGGSLEEGQKRRTVWLRTWFGGIKTLRLRQRNEYWSKSWKGCSAILESWIWEHSHEPESRAICNRSWPERANYSWPNGYRSSQRSLIWRVDWCLSWWMSKVAVSQPQFASSRCK